jgi:predicted RNA-binding Zn-ribbon protein involved in translation (DUF1610 family)
MNHAGAIRDHSKVLVRHRRQRTERLKTMSEAVSVEVAGEPLRCQHCGAVVFFQESATLDRLAFGGLLHLEGTWGHEATIYVCAACGYLHFFFTLDAVRHQQTDAGEAAERVECLSCHAPIPAGASACPACGWSWESADAEVEETAETVECLSCGQMIPAGVSACPACGWSWRPADPELA